jgi:hypothetical protein
MLDEDDIEWAEQMKRQRLRTINRKSIQKKAPLPKG